MEIIPRTEKNRSLYRHHRGQRWHMSTFLALCAALFIFCLWLRPLRLGNGSMTPTFEDKAVVVADRFQKYFRAPERTDIIWFTDNGAERIRRIVAMSGESVSGRNGHVFINGDYMLDEPYLDSDTADFDAFTVPEGTALCLPDNRSYFTGVDVESYCLPIDDIKGLVHLKILPTRQYYY